MTYEIRIATVDITVAKLDKRKRYGLEAVGVIKAGSQFEYRASWIKEYKDGGREFFQPATVTLTTERHKPYGYINAEVEKTLLANSRIKPDLSAIDMLAKEGIRHCADDILQLLLDTGKLSQADLQAAIDKFVTGEDNL